MMISIIMILMIDAIMMIKDDMILESTSWISSWQWVSMVALSCKWFCILFGFCWPPTWYIPRTQGSWSQTGQHQTRPSFTWPLSVSSISYLSQAPQKKIGNWLISLCRMLVFPVWTICISGNRNQYLLAPPEQKLSERNLSVPIKSANRTKKWNLDPASIACRVSTSTPEKSSSLVGVIITFMMKWKCQFSWMIFRIS